jgi:hypothetical protein
MRLRWAVDGTVGWIEHYFGALFGDEPLIF